MKLGALLFLFLLIACSSAPPVRVPASIENDFIFGEIDPLQSSVRQFPPEVEDGLFRHFFYLELRNAKGEYVDCDTDQITLLEKKGGEIPYGFKRLLRGRYYLIVERPAENVEEELEFHVNGSQLKANFRLVLKRPSQENSWIKEINEGSGRLKLKLFLGDSQGGPVAIPSTPELLLEGNAFVADFEHVGEGEWEFDLVLPEVNDIIYISVRAHGAYFHHLYRLQHIEK